MNDQDAVSIKKEGPTLLVLAVNAALIAWTWNRMPVHWNIQGEVDRYGGRFEALAQVPLFWTCFAALSLILLKAGSENAVAMRAMRLGCALLGLAHTATFLMNWTDFRAALLGYSLFLILVGNVQGKIQTPNFWIGFRSPWTKLSRTAWHKSQRRSGLYLVCFGLISVVLALVFPEQEHYKRVLSTFWFFGFIGGTLGLIYLSYPDYRHDPHPEPVGSVRG